MSPGIGQHIMEEMKLISKEELLWKENVISVIWKYFGLNNNNLEQQQGLFFQNGGEENPHLQNIL